MHRNMHTGKHAHMRAYKFCKHLLCCVFPGAGVDTNRNKTKAAEAAEAAEAASEAEVSMQKFKAMLVDTRDCNVSNAHILSYITNMRDRISYDISGSCPFSANW